MAELNPLLPKATTPATARARPLRIQRKCACGKSSEQGECASCKSIPLQRRAAIGREGGALEAEADRAAAAVAVGRPGALPRLSSISSVSGDAFAPIPESVMRATSSSGTALDKSTREFMERGFGADFSTVRVHHDALAIRSARDVGARAYTLGSHVVFGAGEYDPSRGSGRELLAHELAHTLQQTGGTLQLQRACLPSAECAAPRATLTEFVAETQAKPENISKAEKREKACTKSPPDAGCTSDGHGATATALTAILTANYKSRLSYITGIYVDKDIPADWGAVTRGCSNFMPPLPGGRCTFVPDTLEAQAKLYQGGAKTIGASSRQDWLTATIGTLTHETEHARFNAATPIAQPSASACTFAAHKRNLSEMASHLSEMHVYYRAALARPEKGRFKQFYQMFDYWVKNGSEDISGIVKDLRCHCECSDADHYITKTVESVATSQKWDTNEAWTIHTELSKPKWGLKWPVPPGAVDIHDLPASPAAPFNLE
jgi:hypothetical protein